MLKLDKRKCNTPELLNLFKQDTCSRYLISDAAGKRQDGLYNERGDYRD